MFERFTTSARAVVIGAQEHARRLHHGEVLAEHLLLAVLMDDACAGAQVMRGCGVQPARLVDELAALGAADRDALRAIGIDLAAVREHVEAAFGPGALDRPGGRRRRLWRRRGSVGAHLPFSAAAKQALEQSLRQSLALRQREITADHVLLGLLADDEDPAARTLRRLGVPPDVVRAQVRAQLHRAA